VRIGIDFGTSNSAVAYFDGAQLRPVLLDAENENPHVLPSLIYIDRQHTVRLGTAAATEYLERETGRPIVWEERYVGEVEMIVGGGNAPIRYMQDIYIVTDTGANGRLLQSIKTALRDPDYEGTEIFDRYYTIDELVALILSGMKAQAEDQLGQTCDQVVLGRPVRFSDDPALDRRAEAILYRAARFAGFEDVTFQMEPVAAAHLYHRTCADREMGLVFDFGGGTLDLTIAEVGGSAPPRVIATRGVLVGGDDLDRQVMRSLWKYFGEGAMVEEGAPFPPDFLDQLGTWQTMPDLSRPEPLYKIRQYQKSSDNPAAMLALETLVTQNVGFELFREIERTKRALTDTLIARLDFEYQHIHIHERMLRRAFEALIAEELSAVQRELDLVLADAGLRADQIAVVLRTGGTSLVPAFVELLGQTFGYDVLRDMDPITSVGGGMAIVAHEDGGARPQCAEGYVNPMRAIYTTTGHRYEPYVLRTQAVCYTDREYTMAKLPLALSGLYGVRTSGQDAQSEAPALLRLALDRPTKVYVIYQALAYHLPGWLRDWMQEDGMQVELDTSGERMPFFVYSRTFPAGPVTLGGAHAPGYQGVAFLNYGVAVEPVCGPAD